MSKEIKIHKGGDLQSLKGGLKTLGGNLNALSEGLGKIELPRLFYQLVIFVIDGSNSMHGTTINGISKASEIDKSIKQVIKRLKESKNENCFDICFIPFSENFQKNFGIVNVKDLSLDTSFNPFDYIETPKGTKLKEAAIFIDELTQEYLHNNREKNSQVLIQVLSDGAIDDYKETKEIFEEIKHNQKITVSCQFIESEIKEDSQYYSWDESTGKLDYESKWTIEEVKASHIRVSNKFKTLASSEELFITSPDPEEIRKHMIKSISTVSKID